MNFPRLTRQRSLSTTIHLNKSVRKPDTTIVKLLKRDVVVQIRRIFSATVRLVIVMKTSDTLSTSSSLFRLQGQAPQFRPAFHFVVKARPCSTSLSRIPASQIASPHIVRETQRGGLLFS